MSSCGSAVSELYSCEIISAQHHSWELSKIDLKMAIPNGFYERIAPHSSLSISHSIDVGGGVIDSHFTGIIKIILINHSSHPFSDSLGDNFLKHWNCYFCWMWWSLCSWMRF